MVFTAIGAAVAGAFFAAGTTAFLIASSVVAFGLSVGAQALLSKRSKPPKRTYSAVQAQTQYGADTAASVVYGTSKVKGQRIYYAKYGSGNKYNSEVFVLADGWNTGLENEIYFYGKKHNLISQTPVGNEVERYTVEGFDNNIIIRFFDGRPTQEADSELITKTNGLSDAWTETDIVTNQCYVSIDRTYNKKQFGNGKPDFSFILRGLKEYDPRYDGSKGGSGLQRLTDISTWGEATQNPAIHRLNYSLGLKGLISDRVRVGIGLNINQIDVTAHINAANICDTQRTVNDRTIPTYQCSMFVSADDDHIATLQAFEDAMAGYGGLIGGLSSCIAGAPQIPVYDITKDDVRLDAKSVYRPKRSAFDTVNVLSGQFTSKDSFWNAESLNTIKVNADVVADGAQNQDAYDLLQITDSDIAQYVLNIRYRQKRKVARRTIPVSRKCGFAAIEGRWVTYKGKSWLVEKRSFDDLLRFTLVLSETGSDIYAENGIEAGPVISAPTIPANPSLLSTVQNFNVESGFLENDGGQKIPHLKFTWTPPDDPTVTGVIINYAVEGDNTYQIVEAPNAETGELYIATNLVAGKNYEAFASIRTVPDRFTTDTPVVSTTIPVVPISVVLEQIQDDTKEIFIRFNARLDIHENVMHSVSSSAISDQLNSESKREVLKSEFNGSLAQIVTEQATQATENTAQASELTALTASVDDVSAGGLISFETLANPNEADTEIGMFARATLGDAVTQSGIVLKANQDENGGEGGCYLIGDKVAILDGQGNVVALFNSDGQIVQGRLAAESVEAINIVTGTITANEIEINGLTGNVSEFVGDNSPLYTGSDSWSDIVGFTKTVSVVANASLLILFHGNLSTGQAGAADARVLVDGSEWPVNDYRSTVGANTNVGGAFCLQSIATLSAGNHTVNIQWRRRGGVGTRELKARSLIIYQFKR